MAEPEMSPATRLDELAVLDPLTRREVASAVRHCSQWRSNFSSLRPVITTTAPSSPTRERRGKQVAEDRWGS